MDPSRGEKNKKKKNPGFTDWIFFPPNNKQRMNTITTTTTKHGGGSGEGNTLEAALGRSERDRKRPPRGVERERERGEKGIGRRRMMMMMRGRDLHLQWCVIYTGLRWDGGGEERLYFLFFSFGRTHTNLKILISLCCLKRQKVSTTKLFIIIISLVFYKGFIISLLIRDLLASLFSYVRGVSVLVCMCWLVNIFSVSFMFIFYKVVVAINFRYDQNF